MLDTTEMSVDFETRSVLDLKKVGTHIYAANETTDVWCMAYAIGGEPVGLWMPPEPIPLEVYDHIVAGLPVRAWNAAFERLIWRYLMAPRYGWPGVSDEQWHCTMVDAMAMSLPGGLDECAKALRLEHRKDMAGHRLMMQMSRPRRVKDSATVVWWDDADRRQRLGAYCRQDVETERAVGKHVRPLIPYERALWLLDQRINDRGVRIDRMLCERALQVVDGAKGRLDARMAALTGGVARRCTEAAKIAEFIREQGVPTEGVAKDAVADLLRREDLPAVVRAVLELRQESAKSSLAKIPTMLERSTDDGRMRGNLQFHAAGTGRWGGRGAQLQNLPRPKMKSPESAIPAITTGSAEWVEMLFDTPLQVVSDCIRSMITGEP